MSTHKHIDRICCAVLAAVLVLTLLFVNGEAFGLQAAAKTMGYEERLFDTSRVHTLDIVMDDWDGFIDTCENEEYAACAVVIDGESYKNVGIRAKGNTSLSSVAAYGNDRYSFKIEFDHYDSKTTYYGLDKLSLNNIIQDNTYMKDFLSYQMMSAAGAASPLCSYVYITVNGEDWGLYLAIEAIEDSFLQRNYGNDTGNLYKPDSTNFGAGRGNGQGFDMADFRNNGQGREDSQEPPEQQNRPDQQGPQMNRTDQRPQRDEFPDASAEMPPEGFTLPEDFTPPENFTPPEAGEDVSFPDRPSGMGGGMGGGMGSSDVKLQYIDDDPDSYSSIFGNAKSDITEADQTRLIASLKSLSQYENLEDVLDIEQVIRYFVAHTFVCNGDSYTGSMIHNYYLYEKDGRLTMLPWDYNLAFSGFTSGSDATGIVNSSIDSPVSGGSLEDRPMAAWIFSDEEYTQLYHQLYKEFITNYFDSGAFADMIDSTTALITPYVEKDPTKFCTFEEFTAGAAVLKEFCLLRAQSVRGQLDGSNATVDASHLTLSDMGSMDRGGGRGGFDRTPGEGVPVFAGDGQMPQEGGQRPDRMGGRMPGQPDAPPEDTGGNTWIVTGAMVVLLLLGLAAASRFRRKSWL